MAKKCRPPAYWLPYAMRACARKVTWKHKEKLVKEQQTKAENGKQQ